MYIHAYQSYVWNAVVSERIRSFGSENPVPGDVVFDKPADKEAPEGEKTEDGDALLEEQLMEDAGESSLSTYIVVSLNNHAGDSSKRSRKPWEAPRVKTLSEEDLDKYSIFDVIMPLPGKDVAYPGGALGERYRKFLEADGLDPDNWVRKQKFVCSRP